MRGDHRDLHQQVRFGPLQATVSRIKLEAPIPAIPDRRAIELIVLGDDVQLWSMELPATLDGATVLARMPQADAPMRGQAVVLADATGVAYEATVVSSAAAHEIPETVAISVSPAPAGPLLASSAQLLGNVVRASQGETLAGELLGSGDATIAGQRLTVGKPPITYTPAPGSFPTGGRAPSSSVSRGCSGANGRTSTAPVPAIGCSSSNAKTTAPASCVSATACSVRGCPPARR